MPSPVGGMAAPTTQSDPDRAQSILEQTIAGIIAGLVVLAFQLAIVWYAQTGRWEFEELLAYFVQVVLQHLDWPLDPSIPPPS